MKNRKILRLAKHMQKNKTNVSLLNISKNLYFLLYYKQMKPFKQKKNFWTLKKHVLKRVVIYFLDIYELFYILILKSILK